MLGGMISAIKFAAHQESQARQPQPLRHVRPGGHRRASSAASSGPSSSSHYGELVEPDAIRVVRGAIDKRPGSDEANLIVNELLDIEDLEARCTRSV